MLHSAEVRWFIAGALPEVVFDWFRDGRSPEPEERTDHYLLFPGCEAVGVKRRGAAEGQEPRFEIKVLRGGTESVRYPNGVTGRSACWAKWSYGDEPVREWVAALERDPHTWIAARKRRWTRTFATDGRSVAEVAADVMPEAGCDVELAVVRAAGQAWWSVGLEAYRDPARVRAHLRRTGEHFFERYAPPHPLHAAVSLAYPAWLNGLPEARSPDT